ncbi:MAG TPA: hypothetical protein VM367_00745, partial [Pseudonocardia sp.]|nr:hypothetical protein [Pseudonocardia sp.]
MIHGYAERCTLRAGEELLLHVSTDAPAFRVEVYRCGAAAELVSVTGWLPGTAAPPHLPHEDW